MRTVIGRIALDATRALRAVGVRLQQVPTRADRADGQRQRTQPSAEAEHVDVERVSARGPGRPTRPAQRVP